MNQYTQAQPELEPSEYKQYSFCSYCGKPYEHLVWPRECSSCGNLTFRNPIPVVVGLIPINTGILVIRRGTEPGKGRLALPGGFIELGETWQAALAREIYEETNVEIDSVSFRFTEIQSVSDGTIIICGTTSNSVLTVMPDFLATEESTERLLIYEAIELAFPLHTNLVRAYFDHTLNVC